MFDNKILIWIGIALFGYILSRLLFKSGVDHSFDGEMEEILNKEEHKVKGRFE